MCKPSKRTARGRLKHKASTEQREGLFLPPATGWGAEHIRRPVPQKSGRTGPDFYGIWGSFLYPTHTEHLPLIRKLAVDPHLTKLVNHGSLPQELVGELVQLSII